MEISEFPEDEAASLEAFKFRQSSAPQLFLGAYIPEEGNKLIAYICSTLCDSKILTHDSMTNHLPSGTSVCIHSVCVDSKYQRQGVGLGLLEEYIRRFEHNNESRNYERVLLIAHEELIPFYNKAGFDLVGKSDVVHGTRPWFQLHYLLPSRSPDSKTRLGILQALKEQQEKAKQQGSSQPSKRPLLFFSGGVSQVANANKTNKFDLLCPRPGCNSIILKSGAAILAERPSIQLDNPTNLPPPDLLPHLPPPVVPIWSWKIGPPADPMVFENIGFSRDLPSQPISVDNSRMEKLLTCAECDLGPLGWSERRGEEMTYWLVCSRVGYR